MICNTDGESTFFEGDYPFPVSPLERTVHGSFRFRNYVINQQLGAVALTVTSWRDADGYTWSIPESEQFRSLWTRVFLKNPGTAPEDTTTGEGVG
jgi:hypothetical protein